MWGEKSGSDPREGRGLSQGWFTLNEGQNEGRTRWAFLQVNVSCAGLNKDAIKMQPCVSTGFRAFSDCC